MEATLIVWRTDAQGSPAITSRNALPGHMIVASKVLDKLGGDVLGKRGPAAQGGKMSIEGRELGPDDEVVVFQFDSSGSFSMTIPCGAVSAMTAWDASVFLDTQARFAYQNTLVGELRKQQQTEKVLRDLFATRPHQK